MNTPRVTVLMPVHNGERYLEQAVRSILDQTFADFELLIVNDGSTDRTAAVIERLHDPRIRVVVNRENQGVVASLNRGLSLASGEYLARMDADDVALPDRLARQVRFLDHNREVGVVGSAIRIIDGEGSVVGPPVRFPELHGVLLWSMSFSCPLAHPTVMVRCQVMVRLGGYAAEAVHAEDYELWFRAARMTRLANLPEPLLLLRKHPDNLTVRQGAAHGEQVLTIARRVVSSYLGEDLPEDAVASLRYRGERRGDEAVGVARLLETLHERFLARYPVTPAERMAIDRDVAVRLADVALPHLREGALRRSLLKGVRLYPGLPVALLARRLRRAGERDPGRGDGCG